MIGSITGLQMQTMFPSNLNPSPFTNHPELLQLLKSLKIDQSMINRLEEVGMSTPQLIVNAFGLSDERIMESFLILGYQFMVDSNTSSSCRSLVLFARSQTLKNSVTATSNTD